MTQYQIFAVVTEGAGRESGGQRARAWAATTADAVPRGAPQRENRVRVITRRDERQTDTRPPIFMPSSHRAADGPRARGHSNKRKSQSVIQSVSQSVDGAVGSVSSTTRTRAGLRASCFVREVGGREGGRVKQFHHAMRRRRRRRRRGLPACHAPCAASALLSPLCPFIFNHLPHLCLRHRRAGQPARELASGTGRAAAQKMSNKRRRAPNVKVRGEGGTRTDRQAGRQAEEP